MPLTGPLESGPIFFTHIPFGLRERSRYAEGVSPPVKYPSTPVPSQWDVAAPGLIQVASWQHLTWLRAGFSTRHGGESSVYADGSDGSSHDLNLGFTVHDDPDVVERNRARFVQCVAGGATMRLITLRQTHTSLTHVVTSPENVISPDGRAMLEGDGLLTERPGLLLGMGTADCAPVLVVDPVRRAVGAFHAGWRGTLARILESGIARMHEVYGSVPAEMLAAIGPCIGACCYTVGDEVKSSFLQAFQYGGDLFQQAAGGNGDTGKGPGPLRFDLAEANRRQLLSAGLLEQGIVAPGECTACRREDGGSRRYFSHRDENGMTGRMMSVIGIAP